MDGEGCGANSGYQAGIAAVHESAFGTKRTSLFAPHMSAFGGKADQSDFAQCPLVTQSGHEPAQLPALVGAT